MLIPGCPCPRLPSSEMWAQTFSQTGFPMQGQLLSRAASRRAAPGMPEAACDELPSLSSSMGGAGTRGGGGSRVSRAPPKIHYLSMSFHRAFAPLPVFSHTWKPPGCLEAGESISCTSGSSVDGQGWLELTAPCTAGRGPRPVCKPPACQRHRSS